MKRALCLTALVTLSILALSTTSQAAPPFSFSQQAEPELNWQSDLQAAHKVATAQNKPMLLVFGADWCHYCKKLERETLNSKELSAYVNQSFVPVHIDVDKDKKVAQILKVSGLPCTIVLSPNADLLGRIDGFHTASPFHKQLEAARMKHQVVQRASSTAQ
ncbi:thioredoxin family protein [Thalassoglobus sp.]|uniref:thioredoxin family protein n=1 Tax=Thalassoglobus sp. TaxID=2795869 RepID=UPI003AA7CDA3